ncbi:stage III sporulation protein AA [Alicyclobacillus contaminans]|uniref:stage III sporulation protein AA n=1 Tax=Alicyclobacillus contaminans TaxID=392016 RepID=UPI00040CBCD4|nr:stage III sporulation protein AA [Alicyclobacillus contaminans]GMA52389.1 stage III sporulation protein AA [Alicyclobacillus contaminans]
MAQNDLFTPADAGWLQVSSVLPRDLLENLRSWPVDVTRRVEEIRLRIGQPIQICGMDLNGFLHRDSGLTELPSDALVATEEHVQRVLQAVTQASLYAVEEELRRGFVTMPGGHRIGVAGRVVLTEQGHVRTIRDVHALNIRVARERVGASRKLHAYVLNPSTQRPHNVLLISPPQCGKTTLLRDLVRAYSEAEVAGRRRGFKVAVIDERSEISGTWSGVPQFRLGPRTDVLDGCPKAEGMLMAIRSLSPDVVATDEIGRSEDCDVVLEATHAGVAVAATAHADSLEEWRRRPEMRRLFDAGAFTRYVVLSRRRGPGTVESVHDELGRQLHRSSTNGRG